jgi:hypothetical protein
MHNATKNFGQYASDIMEYGPYSSQAEAAIAVGVSSAVFSHVINGRRTQLGWDIGAKFVREHIKVMSAIVDG